MNLPEAKGQLCLSQAGQVLLPSIQVADRFWRRGLGLMGRKAVPQEWGAGLFFPRCGSLHGCLMRFELELWFLDGEGQPIGGPQRLKPWGMAIGPRGTKHCMEIMPGLLSPNADAEWIWNETGKTASLPTISSPH